MVKEIGKVKALYRYPVKSMAGERLSAATLGWHGFMGDRRFAFVRSGVQSGFPWLTASKLPRLVHYVPFTRDPNESSDLPTHVRTPDGRELELRGKDLAQELSDMYGSPVEVMQLDRGIFDEADVSLISPATICAVERKTGIDLDVRRFRPNIVVETPEPKPLEEDEWLGKMIRIGENREAAAINVYMRDIRCMMINIDPSTGEINPSVMKAVSRMNENCAGVYASPIKTGIISVGDKLFLDDQFGFPLD